MRDLPPIYVLRHGQTEWNLAGRHQGRRDSPLTAMGQGQAVEQGAILQSLALSADDTDMWASPQGRAWATAATVAAATGHQPIAEDNLMEISFGDWEGLTKTEIEARWPDAAKIQDMFEWHMSSPGGEGLAELAARADRVLAKITRPTILVTHGITSRVLRGRALSLDADGMGGLPGGQGIVHAVIAGAHHSFKSPQD